MVEIPWKVKGGKRGERLVRQVFRVEVHVFDTAYAENLKGRRGGECLGYLQLMMPEGLDQSVPKLGKETYFLGRTVTPMVEVSLVERWLEICGKYHEGCDKRKLSFGKRPERMKVIDIKKWCVVDLPQKKGDFVTLSYCWGKNQIHKLLQSNLEAWGRPGGLPKLEEMHKTILDSVKLVRKLKMRYLWVDALCIVQDDDGVKIDQMNQMDRIYTCSVFTIAAADGRDCDAGLTGITKPREKFQLIHTINNFRIAVKLPPLKQTLATTTWSTRGWTYQELLLSFSCIFFTPHGLYFQCFTDRVYFEDMFLEGHPSSYESNTSWPHDSRVKRLWLEHSTIPNALADSTVYVSNLVLMLRDYTSRDLTVSNDIYNAFLGIFNRLHALNLRGAHGVIAGLPIWSFDRALLWLPMGAPSLRLLWVPKGNPKWPHAYPPPSWSWSSHSGLVLAPLLDPNGPSQALIKSVVAILESGERVEFPDFMISGYEAVPGDLSGRVPAKAGELARIREVIEEAGRKRELMEAPKVEFRAEVGSQLWVRGEEVGKAYEDSLAYSGIFNQELDAFHTVIKIEDGDGTWAGTLRVPRLWVEERKEDKERVELDLVAVTKMWIRDSFIADPEAWKNSEDTERPFPGGHEGGAIFVIAVERVGAERRRWAVGVVQQAAWVRAGPEEETVVLI